MAKSLYYLFDPLCGWCYGATPSVSILAENIPVKLFPTGLFSGAGARKMDDKFAGYAWGNDQRIARLTGQVFSDQYRERVLGNREQPFDSAPATLALTAVALTAPSKELSALKGIQRLRYVDGGNVTAPGELAAVFQSLGLDDAAQMILNPGAELLEANRVRVEQAQSIMHEFGADGVPAFVLESGGKRQALDSGKVFSNPRELIQQLAVA